MYSLRKSRYSEIWRFAYNSVANHTAVLIDTDVPRFTEPTSIGASATAAVAAALEPQLPVFGYPRCVRQLSPTVATRLRGADASSPSVETTTAKLKASFGLPRLSISDRFFSGRLSIGVVINGRRAVTRNVSTTKIYNCVAPPAESSSE